MDLLTYIETPEFVQSSTGVIRLVTKLKTAISSKELYEAHQILRTIYYRFSRSDDKFEPLVNMLFYGAIHLLQQGEIVSGQDVGTLLLNSVAKLLQLRSPNSKELTEVSVEYHRRNDTPDLKLSRQIADIAIRLPNTELGQNRFVADALKLLPYNIINQVVLHDTLANRFWEARCYASSRYNFLHCASLENAHSIAIMLVDYHCNFACRRELDLFISQFIFQFLCLCSPNDQTPVQYMDRQRSKLSSKAEPSKLKSRSEIKLIASNILLKYTATHPLIQRNDFPFSLSPLLNFTYFVISLIESREQDTFKVLCAIYKQTWRRDRCFADYLTKIGTKYFGIPNTNEQPQGGIFSNILQSIFDREEEASESIDLD